MVFGSAFSQNLKGYTVTAKDTLRTDKLLQFNSEPELGAFVEYSMQVDTANRTIVLTNDESEIGMQLGQELWLQIKNGNGSTFANGAFVYITGGSEGKPTVEVAHNRDFETVDAIGMITHDVETGTFGFATTFGTVGGLNTSGETEGDIVYVDTLNGGKNWTTTIPEFANFQYEMGFIHTVDPTEGKIFINPKGQVDDIMHNINNANILENFSFTAESDGATITGTLESTDGKDYLTLRWSDGFAKIAVPCTITIPAGTDNNSQTAYIYIPKSTGVLTSSTSYFPIGTQYKTIVRTEAWSALRTQTEGLKGNQNYNDFVASTGSLRGRISQIGNWQRLRNLKYINGSNGTVTVRPDGAGPDTVSYDVTQGIWSQSNEQLLEAMNMYTGDVIHALNYPDHADTTLTDLSEILVDATGASLANRSWVYVFWISQNKTGEPSHMYVNLPNGSYSSGAAAESDALGFKVTEIPYELRPYSGFVTEVVMTHTNPSGGTWAVYSSTDIQGNEPGYAGGGAGSGTIGNFDDLGDTPSTKAGSGGYFVTVDPLEADLVYTAKSAISLTDFDSTGFRLTQSQIIGLVDTISDHRTDINTALALTWQDVIDNGTATVTNTITTNGLILTGTNSEIKTNSSDGSDTKRLRLSGGGSISNTRGAYANLFGNEYAFNAGDFEIIAGDVSGGAIKFYTGSLSQRLIIDNNGDATFTNTVTHLAPTLSTESALLDDIEGGTRDGDFATLAIAGSPITNSYISNVTEASNNITFTGVGSAFNGSISSIAKTDVANSFIVSTAGYMMDLFNSNGSGSGLRVRGNNIALSVNDASAVERFRVEGDGDIFALNLSSGTKTNVVYIDPSTKELFEGAAPTGLWTEDTNGIIYDSGNVGINTASSSPNALKVDGDTGGSAIQSLNASTSSSTITATNSANGVAGAGIFTSSSTSGSVTALKGTISAGGSESVAVTGQNASTTTSAHYGGLFQAVNGSNGIAVKLQGGKSAILTDFNTAPSSTGDTGTTGEIRFTTTHIYICTATNTWKRVAIATW